MDARRADGAEGRAAKNDLLQGVQRACAILHLLARERRPLSPVEISDGIGVKLPTCYHLLNTLEHEGFLQRDGARRLWLGQRIGELHDAYEAALRPDERLLAELDELCARTGETAYLGVWDGDDVLSVAVREGRAGVHVRGLHLGYRDHAYARALGRVLLAFRDEAFLDAYFARTTLEPLTERTLTDPAELRRELGAVRRQGYAVEREEFTQGVCCAAAPILDAQRRAVAALSVSVPRARFDHEGDVIVAAVTAAAAAGARSLAGSRDEAELGVLTGA